MLERISAGGGRGRGGSGSGPLSRHECPAVMDDAFWAPFTKGHRRAKGLFAQCGLSRSDAAVDRDAPGSPHQSCFQSQANDTTSSRPFGSTSHAPSQTQTGRSLTRPFTISATLAQTSPSSTHFSPSSACPSHSPGHGHRHSHRQSTLSRTSRNSNTSNLSNLYSSLTRDSVNSTSDSVPSQEQQQQQQREAYRKSAEFAARRQRGIERDRERAWHSGKAQKRMENGTYLS
ncbi:hypothetical protein BD289DRAFT_434472 [Coniella lustricola]|uniref:Uncharacterized protein n=1 Tax=Coniella lustricola TaxID=2025994 RepID=A0A2T3A7D5_9PEZI|nr:hypothetical protein BD289DRAFT_434472 [Coniella lustricola]